MPAILVPSRRILQPQDFTQLENHHWLFDRGGEIFSHTVPFVNGLTGQIAGALGSPTIAKAQARGVNLSDVDGVDSAFLSQSAVTPPADCTMFAVFATTGISGPDRKTVLCGFPRSNSGGSTWVGGDAHMSIQGSLDQFGSKILGVDLTYSDATSESVYLAGSSSGNRSVWFVAASYKDASLLDMYARDLVSGEEVSSSTSKTKSLKQVAQKFNIGSCAPNGTTSWAETCTRAFAYVGWVPKFVPRVALAELGRNPWAIFRTGRTYFLPSAGGGGAITGTGSPAAQSATVSGTATRTVTGSGTPTAQAATVSGTAEREITSSGTPAAQSATVSGTGTVGAVVTGSGAPQAQSATVAGTAERTVTASGTVAAQSATVAGTAEREITSSGTPTAQSATVVGTGQVGNIISGSGTPTAQSATVSGAAEREITASGTVSASSAAVVGTAERTITGSGTLSASSATVYGFDSAPVSGNPTSGGGTGKVYSSKKLRREVDEWLEKQQESERQKILARIQREDEELLVIMLALAA